ncbi:MAG: hypothetical protein JWP40_3790 [Blastococcus sp.]|nr:hypothetical protein [Blastococcus sp.]
MRGRDTRVVTGAGAGGWSYRSGACDSPVTGARDTRVTGRDAARDTSACVRDTGAHYVRDKIVKRFSSSPRAAVPTCARATRPPAGASPHDTSRERPVHPRMPNVYFWTERRTDQGETQSKTDRRESTMGKKEQDAAWERAAESAAFRHAAERDARGDNGITGRVDHMLDERNKNKKK